MRLRSDARYGRTGSPVRSGPARDPFLLLSARPRRGLARRTRRHLPPVIRRRARRLRRPWIWVPSSARSAHLAMRLEHEAMSDISMLPDTPGALVRQWRSFDRDGSALGALINVGWVALAACVAVLAEKAVARGLSRRVRRRDAPAPGGSDAARSARPAALRRDRRRRVRGGLFLQPPLADGCRRHVPACCCSAFMS